MQVFFGQVIKAMASKRKQLRENVNLLYPKINTKQTIQQNHNKIYSNFTHQLQPNQPKIRPKKNQKPLPLLFADHQVDISPKFYFESKQKQYRFLLSQQNTSKVQYQANKPIEDRIQVQKLNNLPCICLSVFDGHGGHLMADYAAKNIAELIDQFLGQKIFKEMKAEQYDQLIKQSIKYAYKTIQQNFYQLVEKQYDMGNRDILKMGTCGVTALIYKNKIYLGNLGDSQAILIKKTSQNLINNSKKQQSEAKSTDFQSQHGQKIQASEKYIYVKLNQRHSTSNPLQLQRVHKKFNTIDSNILVKNKQSKTYLKGFLEPTRTLGDYYLKSSKYFSKVLPNQPFNGPYILSQPEIQVFQIDQTSKYLILASDGLWDFVSKRKIVQISQCFDQKTKQFHKKTLFDFFPLPLKKNESSLAQMLKMQVISRCAKRINISSDQLNQIQPGNRRKYCDDISIITFKFVLTK